MHRLEAMALTAATVVVAAITDADATQARRSVAVIGTGRMGTAIGGRFAGLGYGVIYGSLEPASDRVLAVVKAPVAVHGPPGKSTRWQRPTS
jgi:lactate dehydrogenase-like 2-hydroxyacid dehydrogenase